jgi:hypothetical protein
LDIGSPDMPPPPVVVEALHRSALEGTHHGYGGFSGTPALRASPRTTAVVLAWTDPDRGLPLIGSKDRQPSVTARQPWRCCLAA